MIRNMTDMGNYGVKYHASDKNIIYIGCWNEEDGVKSSRTPYARCLFGFRGEKAAVNASGSFSYSLDGSDDAFFNNNILINAENDGYHTLFLCAADAGCKIISLECSELVSAADELKRRMEAEYEEIRKGRGASNPLKYKHAAAAEYPSRGIRLDGRFGDLFGEIVAKLSRCSAEPDFIDKPCGRAGDKRGWSGWLPAANDGRILGGMSNALMWLDDTETIGRFRGAIEGILGRIGKNIRSDGYYNYYPESESYECNCYPGRENPSGAMVNSERKNYDLVFWTRGLIAAYNLGFPDALSYARRMYDWLEGSRYCADLLNGSNATNGMPGAPLMALTELGRQSDIEHNQKYFDQHYLEEAFIKGDPSTFGYYPGERPHCYELLGLEMLADEYRLTGERRYLDALLGAWNIYRRYYKHSGGATAICETGGPYPPGSYYLDTGHTGETCGSVFWIWVNRKLSALFPDESAFQSEIEESLWNIALSIVCGKNVRYHNRLSGVKDEGGSDGTCCEVSATLLLSSLAEYVYLTDACGGIHINQYMACRAETEAFSFILDADIPRRREILFTVAKAPEHKFELYFRIPDWCIAPVVCVGGIEYEAKPASYFKLSRVWKSGDTVTLAFPAVCRTVRYAGTEQPDAGYERRALFYGPTLMALTGYGDKPRFDFSADRLTERLSLRDGKLVFGTNRFEFVPYCEIGDGIRFECFPEFIKNGG